MAAVSDPKRAGPGDEARRVAHVLVVEDDPSVRDVVRRYLERDGHRVSLAPDGDVGLHLARTLQPDLIVLDVMLPYLDGLAVCSALREVDRSAVPIIMLTALGEEDDRIAGLTIGADDYVTKPFSAKELALRVGSVLRRSDPESNGLGGRPRGVVVDGDLLVDRDARTVSLRGAPVELTVREFDLLSHLITHPGQVFGRTELLEQVWGWSYGDHSTVTVHVKRLRHKVERDPSAPQRISTVYGVGYRYDPQSPQTSGGDRDAQR